jgi:rare lipoprotein A
MKKIILHLTIFLCMVMWGSCLPKKVIQSKPPPQCQYGKPYQIKNKWYQPMTYVDYFEQKGVASWYGKKFHGRKTSNGETYNMYAISAAHKTLPLGTYVKVYNLDNKKCMTVRINDRGPFIEGRIIDLSYGAANRLGIVQKGTANVFIRTINKKTKTAALKRSKKLRRIKKVRQKKHVRQIKKARLKKHVERRKQVNKIKPIKRIKPIDKRPQKTSQDLVSGNCFQIQVGAFGNRQNAVSLCNRLKPLYNDSHIMVSKNGGNPLYRVLIGNCMPQHKARYVERQLGHHGFQDAFVVAQIR